MADSSTRTPFFTNVIARGRGGRPGANNVYRRYGAVIQTVARLQSVDDTVHKTIHYEVGRRAASARAALQHPPNGTPLFVSPLRMTDVVSSELTAISKKFSNFSGHFDVSHLSGVVERLAAGLASWSLYEHVDGEVLRSGQSYDIIALGALSNPVSSYNNMVFIPRFTDTVMASTTFSILCAAVCGEMGRVATDVLEINAANNSPIIEEVTVDAFPAACVDALRILGANFAASNGGDQFALAVTTGLHSVLTVVGHTDEGDITRDVLRRGSFESPFGSIHGGLDTYVGIPALESNNLPNVAAYVDAMALATAGLVAHCDPGLSLDNSWFPTVIQATTTTDNIAEPGDNLDGTDEMMARARATYISLFPAFSHSYCLGLQKMFGFTTGSGIAENTLTAKCSSLPAEVRHLRYPTVSPFFWIEPTSLIPHDFTGFISETEGFASKATPGIPHDRAAFEWIRPYSTREHVFSEYVVGFRGARSCPFLDHWHGHPANGIGALIPRQLDPERVVLPGPNDIAPVRQRLSNNVPLSGYLWRRGQSPLPAPAEFLNLGKTMGLSARHYTLDYNSGVVTPENLPSWKEFGDLSIRYTVGVPTGLNDGGANAAPSDARRARTRAAEELVSWP
ncbi:major capsid protein [Xylariaceae sp. FL0804]|nr:major capsid protein [Xylariaceae sp. FL0804]